MFLFRFSFQKTPRKTDHPDLTANDTAMAKYDFDNPIYQAEEGAEEVCELPEGLARLLKQEDRAITPYQEVVETVNVGTEDDKKEIKIGASLQAERKRPLIMYLTVLERSMGCVLGQHDESGRKEHAIYYLSKSLPTVNKDTHCSRKLAALWHGLLAD